VQLAGLTDVDGSNACPDSNIPSLGANLLDGNSLFALHNLIHPHPTSNRVLARLVGGTEQLGKGKR